MRTFLKRRPSKELIEAAKLVFMAKAACSTIRPIVRKIQSEILLAGKYKNSDRFRTEEDPKFVVDPAQTVDLSNEDFQDYYQKCYAKYIEAGYNIPYEYCPLLMAEEAERKAIRHMITLSQELHNEFDVSLVYQDLDHLEEYTNITLKYLKTFITDDANAVLREFIKKKTGGETGSSQNKPINT